ncbi:hypothetical protein BJ165DRAFT_1410441 [Panaeolus papilionaceus]|nr:hypothetical protein BJ165DRAFT_1410441 [Panaeolus papilionaceus]
MSNSDEPQPAPSSTFEVEVLGTISYRTPAPPPPTTSKGKTKTASKGKLESKNKEFTFTFEANSENYLLFLSTLLEKHRYPKYTPVKVNHYFTVKIGVGPKKLKKDALDVEKLSKYHDIVQRLINEQPTKLTTYFNLDDVKVAQKRKEVGSDEDEDGGELVSENESDIPDAKTTAFEKELARNCLLLEEKYQNTKGGGWSFLLPIDGTLQPLTPHMMLEWARAVSDSKATVDMPPNTMTFDPVYCGRSLLQTPKSCSTSVLSELSSIFQSTRAILVSEPGHLSSLGTPWQPGAAAAVTPAPSITPSTSSTTTLPASPTAIHSPSKLPAFLKFAEQQLGYGPDILCDVNNKDLVACGLTPGDAIRIKCGARDWWSGPEAKCRCHQGDLGSGGDAPQVPVAKPVDNIHFIKKFPEDKGGGGLSVFGTGIEMGEAPDPDQFSWHYFNRVTKREEPLPQGMVPVLLAEYAAELEMDQL